MVVADMDWANFSLPAQFCFGRGELGSIGWVDGKGEGRSKSKSKQPRFTRFNLLDLYLPKHNLMDPKQRRSRLPSSTTLLLGCLCM